jgi:hypothetical protein
MMKTVPSNFTADDAATYAAAQLKQQRDGMMKKWAPPSRSQGGAAGGLGATPGADGNGLGTVGKNGSSLQQPPQVGQSEDHHVCV